MSDISYKKPNIFAGAVLRVAAFSVSKALYHCHTIRNDLKGVKGPFVVLANHESALDFVNCINQTSVPLTTVISNSFFQTLPIKGFLSSLGVIPKNQFQTTIADIKKMRNVITQGHSLLIYPAGLMSENGLSTPIPSGTSKFLKLLGADVYVARSSGAYFVMPKWSKKTHPGRTEMSICKLFSKDELKDSELEEIDDKMHRAMEFDAYRENDQRRSSYKDGDNIEGLEYILYRCPHCHAEYTMRVKDKNTIICDACGYSERSDKYGMLHKTSEVGDEIRYVSDWSRMILNEISTEASEDDNLSLSCDTEIQIIDDKHHRFVPAGSGNVSISKDGITLTGTLNG